LLISIILAFPIGIIILIAVYVGINVIAERVFGWVFFQPIVLGLIGAWILLFSGWALGWVITRASTLGIPFARFSKQGWSSLAWGYSGCWPYGQR
jgi:hypothetical protein